MPTQHQRAMIIKLAKIGLPKKIKNLPLSTKESYAKFY
jgi:hypothetical protein